MIAIPSGASGPNPAIRLHSPTSGASAWSEPSAPVTATIPFRFGAGAGRPRCTAYPPPVRCTACGTENADGKKFCTECGTALMLACPSCGATIAGTEKFCGECGAALAGAAAASRPAPAVPPQSPPAPVAERRLVSVLFADLVGFTQLSEGRDAEAVRELLSRYFESCRRLIEL